MPHTAFIRKMAAFQHLDEIDKSSLLSLPSRKQRIPRRRGIAVEHSAVGQIMVVAEGWIARFCMNAKGERAITGFLLPGDQCAAHHHSQALESFVAIEDAVVAFVDAGTFYELATNRPNIFASLRQSALAHEATLQQWIVGLGRRSSYQRVAHLICELHERLRMVGLAQDGSLFCPLTQYDIGDSLGLTSVHVNRTFRTLRDDNLAMNERDIIRIPNLLALREAADFDPRYLHSQP